MTSATPHRFVYSRSTLLQRRAYVISTPSREVKRLLWRWGIFRRQSAHSPEHVSPSHEDGAMDQRSRRRAPCQKSAPAEEANDPPSLPNPPHPASDPGSQLSENRQDEDFLDLGPVLRVLTLNTEGLTTAKRELIATICEEHKVDVLCLQETHTASTAPAYRLKIRNFDLISFTGHEHHGRATYVRSTCVDVEAIGHDDYSDTIRIGNYTVTNVYKPPTASWASSPLTARRHPSIYVGDFNSHHTAWGYDRANSDGEWLTEWASHSNLSFVIDLKQRKTFHSARWNHEYNPDLCWVSTADGQPLPATTTVLANFPKSQHRPVLVHIGVRIPLVQSLPKPRWNFRKANWKKYAERMDKSSVCIPHSISLTEAYDRFSRAIFIAASKSIPRGFRPRYIPCLDSECRDLLDEFSRSRDPEIADQLVEALSCARKTRWEEATSKMDFTHSSRKSWTLMRKLNSGQSPVSPARCQVSPDAVAHHLMNLGKAPISRKRKKNSINKQWRDLLRRGPLQDGDTAPQVTQQEVSVAMKDLKTGKAAGYDNVFPEFLKNLGPNALKWLSKFFSRILTEQNIPKQWRRAKVIAIPKPNKDRTEAANYRPISLLSVTFKLLERIVLRRVSDAIENTLDTAQAGFRRGRSTQDQVLALTTYIENGFQRRLKTGAIFLDLTAAYDTVWHKGLLVKAARILPRWAVLTIAAFIHDRRFRVHMGEKCSAWRLQKNGLPQGSVLAPTLFNLYTSDLPETTSRKFIYADDICCAHQERSFEQLDVVLNEDIQRLTDYCKEWKLKPSANKTVSSVFHLHNTKSQSELNIFLNGARIRHDQNPVYLGVTLDRSLTYRSHLQKLASKVRTRNNLLQMIAGSTWGADAKTLRTAALALCYSAAEYCAPVWRCSTHCIKVDTQLNAAMRIISGTIRSTQVDWLPVLCNIPPPSIRREVATRRLLDAVRATPNLPLLTDISSPPRLRLTSRHPIWRNPPTPDFDATATWRAAWSEVSVHNKHLIDDPTHALPGFQLQRRLWNLLNRFRTAAGICAHTLCKWGARRTTECICGHPDQTMMHIIVDCPRLALEGGLLCAHSVSDAAVEWLQSFSTADFLL